MRTPCNDIGMRRLNNERRTTFTLRLPLPTKLDVERVAARRRMTINDLLLEWIDDGLAREPGEWE